MKSIDATFAGLSAPLSFQVLGFKRYAESRHDPFVTLSSVLSLSPSLLHLLFFSKWGGGTLYSPQNSMGLINYGDHQKGTQIWETLKAIGPRPHIVLIYPYASPCINPCKGTPNFGKKTWQGPDNRRVRGIHRIAAQQCRGALQPGLSISVAWGYPAGRRLTSFALKAG